MRTKILRIAIFAGVAAATVALVLSFVPVWQARHNPSADGLQWVLAIIVVPLYGALILPAFGLALWGRPLAVIIGAVLTAVAFATGIAIFWN